MSDDAKSAKFDACVAFLKGLPKEPRDGDVNISNMQKLHFYGLYKQATEGDCTNTASPSWFNPVAQAKYRAWNEFVGKDRLQAKSEYVTDLLSLLERSAAESAEFKQLKAHLAAIDGAARGGSSSGHADNAAGGGGGEQHRSRASQARRVNPQTPLLYGAGGNDTPLSNVASSLSFSSAGRSVGGSSLYTASTPATAGGGVLVDRRRLRSGDANDDDEYDDNDENEDDVFWETSDHLPAAQQWISSSGNAVHASSPTSSLSSSASLARVAAAAAAEDNTDAAIVELMRRFDAMSERLLRMEHTLAAVSTGASATSHAAAPRSAALGGGGGTTTRSRPPRSLLARMWRWVRFLQQLGVQVAWPLLLLFVYHRFILGRRSRR